MFFVKGIWKIFSFFVKKKICFCYLEPNLLNYKNLNFVVLSFRKKMTDCPSLRKYSPSLIEVLDGNTTVYDKWAPEYERDMEAVGFPGPVNLANALAKVFEKPDFPFKDHEKIRVLDIGSGTGWTAQAVLAAVKNPERLHITGADISTEMIKQAEAKKIYHNLIEVDLNSNDVEGEFDIVISTGTFALGHVKLDYLFRIVEKNLGPNGFIMCSSKSTYFQQEYADKLKESGCSVEQDKIQIYGKGDMAELLTISRNPIFA